MTDNEMYMKLSDKIDKLIDKIDTKLYMLDSKLQNHEVRIVVLEKRPSEKEQASSKDWKTDIIMLLTKAITIGAVGIATLAGGGAVLSKIL